MFQMDTQSKPAAVGSPLEAAWAPQDPLHARNFSLQPAPSYQDTSFAAVMQALGQLALASDAPAPVSPTGSSLLPSPTEHSQSGDTRLPRGSQYGGPETSAFRQVLSTPSLGLSGPQAAFTNPLLQNMDPCTLASLLSTQAVSARRQANVCEELLLTGLAPLNPHSRAPGSPTHQSSSPNSLYKTELCRSWQETGSCRYGGKCQFAHGREELRPVQRHPKYKTEICRTFATTGTCPYGTRCRFIHYYAKPSASTGAPLPPLPSPRLQVSSGLFVESIARSQGVGMTNGFGHGLGSMLLGQELEAMLAQSYSHQAGGLSQGVYMPPLPPVSSSGFLPGLPSLVRSPSVDSNISTQSPTNACIAAAPNDGARLPVFKNFTPE